MVKRRVIIEVRYDVSYIMDIPEDVLNDRDKLADYILDHIDPSKWEYDPGFYEGLWDAIEVAIEKDRFEVEEVE